MIKKISQRNFEQLKLCGQTEQTEDSSLNIQRGLKMLIEVVRFAGWKLHTMIQKSSPYSRLRIRVAEGTWANNGVNRINTSSIGKSFRIRECFNFFEISWDEDTTRHCRKKAEWKSLPRRDSCPGHLRRKSLSSSFLNVQNASDFITFFCPLQRMIYHAWLNGLLSERKP